MQITYGNESGLLIKFDAILKSKGLVRTDVVDVIFIVKNRADDGDGDAVLDVRLGNGIEWKDDTESLVVSISQDQWLNIPPSKQYLFKVGFKLVGTSSFIECMNKDGQYGFIVLPDFIRS